MLRLLEACLPACLLVSLTTYHTLLAAAVPTELAALCRLAAVGKRGAQHHLHQRVLLCVRVFMCVHVGGDCRCC